jgi:hypothetical protein
MVAVDSRLAVVLTAVAASTEAAVATAAVEDIGDCM